MGAKAKVEGGQPCMASVDRGGGREGNPDIVKPEWSHIVQSR